MRTSSAIRAGIGLVHLAIPDALISPLTGETLSHRGRRVVQVLGARQVAQAILSGRAPNDAALWLGAEVDVAHAASMIALAVAERRYRRIALCDAAIATAFAIWGVTAARRAPPGTVGSFGSSRWRDQVAERLARFTVPGYRPPTDADDR